ncbi:MAG: HEPN domain-containing protein [Candidatus Magnetobacterium sp. LHC-1]|uniref:HEPN domain-containing protein n=1 Tax=Candidatus Magnetobacterium casense TaxID=1455061 RepID=A0ABS6RY00_9BACT|nr:HEPN domain-containing protein [Candidatus Magnetobacterium casensis]MBF0606713.1 HEPN domain-containing protein [Nitrospirota bacterium]MBV6341503.1 HEPN domain-containing protein [Candidatus Magnetobacterium casensis]
MKGDKLDVVRAWLQKAENDLITAKHTMKLEKPPCDTVCFHAQQCAEKYIKGYLTYIEKEFPKTHSIEDLILLCRDICPSIELEADGAEVLSSYSVEVRYPSEVYYEIPREDAEEAIAIALKIRAVILNALQDKL